MVDSPPRYRLESASGRVIDDPAESAIQEALDNEAPDGHFVITDLSKVDGTRFIQALGFGDTWLVEHRDGAADPLWQAVDLERDVADRVISGWISGRVGWRELASWAEVVLGSDDSDSWEDALLEADLGLGEDAPPEVTAAWRLLKRLAVNWYSAGDGDLWLALIYLRECHPALWRQIAVSPDRARLLDEADVLPSHLREILGQYGDEMWPVDWFLRVVTDGMSSRALFEAVLAALSEGRSRATVVDRGTGGWLAELQVALVGPANSSVLDPACGLGGGLLAAARHGATELLGFEMDERLACIARMRLETHNVPARVESADALATEPEDQFDAVVLEPPVASRVEDVHRDTVLNRFGDAIADGAEDAAWLALTSAKLAAGGRAAVILADSTLKRRTAALAIALLGCRLEAVIALPEGVIGDRSFAASLLVLRKATAVEEALQDATVQKALVVNTGPLCVLAEGRVVLPPEGIAEISRLVAEWRVDGVVDAPPHIAQAFAVSRLTPGGEVPRQMLGGPNSSDDLSPRSEHSHLRALRLTNFKSLAGARSIELAPLTLIYGANSAGKSSLIQALLLLVQSIRADRLEPDGGLVKLGSFHAAVAGHDESRTIAVGIDFGSVIPLPADRGVLDPRALRSFDLEIGSSGGAGEVRLARLELHTELDCAGSWPGERPDRTRSPALGFHRRLGKPDRWDMLRYELGNLHWFLKHPDAIYGADRRPWVDNVDAVAPAARELEDGPSDYVELVGSGLLPTDVVSAEPEQDRHDLNIVLSLFREELARLASKLVYLGPLRPTPERYYVRSEPDRTPGRPNLAAYLYDNEIVLQEVNHWFERLGVPYRMLLERLTAARSGRAIDDLIAVALTDRRSGVTVSPADVGFGISQTLPVIVECLRSEQSVICVEQPELHLHPRLQANLGDLFIESVREGGAGNQLIVETHSEHLLLRLQRRIREGSIHPDAVAVLYVDQDDSGAVTVTRLRLGSEGELLDPWPTGFFDDSLEDILGGWG